MGLSFKDLASRTSPSAPVSSHLPPLLAHVQPELSKFALYLRSSSSTISPIRPFPSEVPSSYSDLPGLSLLSPPSISPVSQAPPPGSPLWPCFCSEQDSQNGSTPGTWEPNIPSNNSSPCPTHLGFCHDSIKANPRYKGLKKVAKR